jgi:hypothetical protein
MSAPTSSSSLLFGGLGWGGTAALWVMREGVTAAPPLSADAGRPHDPSTGGAGLTLSF